MKETVRVVGYVKTSNGKHYVKEDKIDMEVHDLVDYLTYKYITRGNKLATLPVRFITEMGRAETEFKDKYGKTK